MTDQVVLEDPAMPMGDQAEQPQEIDPRDTPDYWRKFVKAGKKAARNHWDYCRRAWDEFEKTRSVIATTPTTSTPRNPAEPWLPYPIYFSCVKTLEPAYYSRTPIVNAEREFGIEDEVAITMSTIAERLGKWSIKNGNFDAVMRHGVAQYIHCDKASLQVIYDRDLEDDGMGGQIAVNQKIYLAPLNFDEIIHTPNAKTENDMREKAYYFRLPKDVAKKKFDPAILANIEWKSYNEKKQDKSDQRDASLEMPGEFIEGWECHSKPNKKIYFISEQYQEGFLKVVEGDPTELKGFFPSTPFQISSPSANHMYPVPIYGQCETLLITLHSLEERQGRLIKSVRRRALADGSIPELIALVEETGDQEVIFCQNLQQILEKGGIKDRVLWLEVTELVSSIGESQQIKSQLKDEFYEWFGMPDILRGTSDPVETAAAQEIKSASASDRFKFSKKQIAQMASDGINLMVDMALKVFSDEKIAQIVGFNYMSPEEQKNFPEALARLRSDEEEIVSLTLETDSLTFLDQQLKEQQIAKASQTLTTGLQAIAQTAEQGPEFVAAGLTILLESLDSMALGKRFIDASKKAVDALLNKISNPPPPPPPPPDYEMLKIQSLQAKQATDNFKVQSELMVKQREQDRKDYETQVETQNLSFKQQIEGMGAQLDQRIQQFVEFIESQRLQIEQYKVRLDEQEKFIEESRLANEQQIEKFNAIQDRNTELQQPAAMQAPIIVQPPPMAPMNLHFTIDAKSKGASVTSIVHDLNGDATMTTLPLPEAESPIAGVGPTMGGL